MRWYNLCGDDVKSLVIVAKMAAFKHFAALRYPQKKSKFNSKNVYSLLETEFIPVPELPFVNSYGRFEKKEQLFTRKASKKHQNHNFTKLLFILLLNFLKEYIPVDNLPNSHAKSSFPEKRQKMVSLFNSKFVSLKMFFYLWLSTMFLQFFLENKNGSFAP